MEDNKISMKELHNLFGPRAPIECLTILENKSNEPIEVLRKKLAKLATTKKALSKDKAVLKLVLQTRINALAEAQNPLAIAQNRFSSSKNDYSFWELCGEMINEIYALERQAREEQYQLELAS